MTSITVTADVDAENALRTAVLEFMDTVRGAEKAIAADRRGEDVAAELDVAAVGAITEEEWRAHWLPAVDEPAVDEIEEPESAEADDEPTDEAVDTVAEASEDAAGDEQHDQTGDAE
jgi:XTP/dITP diphosphohydrolase